MWTGGWRVDVQTKFKPSSNNPRLPTLQCTQDVWSDASAQYLLVLTRRENSTVDLWICKGLGLGLGLGVNTQPGASPETHVLKLMCDAGCVQGRGLRRSSN